MTHWGSSHPGALISTPPPLFPQSPNPDVTYCIVMAIAAFSHDVAQEHAHGPDLLFTSGLASELIAALLPILEEAVVKETSSSRADERDDCGSKQMPVAHGVTGTSENDDSDHRDMGHLLKLRSLIAVGRGGHPLLSLIEGAALALQACVVPRLNQCSADPGEATSLSLSDVSRIACLAELLGQQLKELVQQVWRITLWMELIMLCLSARTL